MWESKVVWPQQVSTGNTENISTDKHSTEDQARAVCVALIKEGLGGMGQIFPISTSVRELKGEKTG